MTIKRYKLGTRLLTIILICGFLLLAILLGSVVLTIQNYNRSNSIDNARGSAVALEKNIQSAEDNALKHAKTIAANSALVQALFSRDTGSLTQILTQSAESSGADFIIAADRSGVAQSSTVESFSLTGDAVVTAMAKASGGTAASIMDTGITSRLSAVSVVPVNASGVNIGSLVLGYSLEHEQLVDSVKAMTGDDVTLFYGDTRVNTTIVKDGQRIIGTKADEKVADRILNKGESFSGELTIVGIPYITYYMPLKDSGGNNIGILFSGTPQTEAQATVNRMIVIFLILGAFMLTLLAVLMTVYMRKAISLPLGQLLKTANQIADGNLATNLSIRSKNEIGELADAFLRMSTNLNEMIGSISNASDQITQGARQVSDSSVSLASGASTQASAVEEFSSSLEQISAQTKQNSDRASQADELSRSVLSKAEEGNAQMHQMLSSMEEINRASESIARIIKVIDDIAFQTNILALNAAVEAARAGEHGKGFAVVAQEVRNLAARSAEAAKETTSSIGNSIREVEKGAKIADATAEMLHAIVEGVSKTASLINDIAGASAQQVTAIAQMDQGIGQITDVMQSNSAASEENASASEALLAQAEVLRTQVSSFTLRGSEDSDAASSFQENPQGRSPVHRA